MWYLLRTQRCEKYLDVTETIYQKAGENCTISINYFIIRLNTLRKMGWEGHVARMVEIINSYNIFVSNAWKKKSLEGLKCEDNIKIDKEDFSEGVDEIHLSQGNVYCRVLIDTILGPQVP